MSHIVRYGSSFTDNASPPLMETDFKKLKGAASLNTVCLAARLLTAEIPVFAKQPCPKYSHPSSNLPAEHEIHLPLRCLQKRGHNVLP